MRVVAIVSNEGGLGRTAAAINLARGIVYTGKTGTSVRVLDLDSSQALMRYSGFDSYVWYGTPRWSGGSEITAHSPANVHFNDGPVLADDVRKPAQDECAGHHITIIDTPPGLAPLTRVAISLADIVLLLAAADRRLPRQVDDLASHLSGLPSPPLLRVVGVRKRSAAPWGPAVRCPGICLPRFDIYPFAIPETEDLPASMRAGLSILDFAPDSKAAEQYNYTAIMLNYEIGKAKVERFLATVS